MEANTKGVFIIRTLANISTQDRIKHNGQFLGITAVKPVAGASTYTELHVKGIALPTTTSSGGGETFDDTETYGVFNGVNQYVMQSSAITLTDYTIMAWLYMDAAETEFMLFGGGDRNANGTA